MAGPLSLLDEFTWMANKGAMKMNLLKSLRSYLAYIALGLMCLSYANAKEGLVIPIWPEGVPGAHVNAGPEKHVDGRYYNIQNPTLTYFSADPDKACGTAIIICPGGGYVRLAVGMDGGGSTGWLNKLGVSVFILKYRLGDYGQPAPLQDVLRAVRLVRSRATEFKINPDKIGIFGGSAGGHLAAVAGTMYNDIEGKTGAPIDIVDAKPNFLILQYPVITMQEPYVHKGSRNALLGKNPTEEMKKRYSAELNVTKDTPPCFIFSTLEDKSVPMENSILFYRALRNQKVPAELHIFERGAHGFGFGKNLGSTSEWPKLCEIWLSANGWITKP